MNVLTKLIQEASNAFETTNPDLDSLKTTSEKIRHLNSKGLSRSDIAKTLGIKYQHVRNVLVKPLKQA